MTLILNVLYHVKQLFNTLICHYHACCMHGQSPNSFAEGLDWKPSQSLIHGVSFDHAKLLHMYS